jgi:hypothetical protein
MAAQPGSVPEGLRLLCQWTSCGLRAMKTEQRGNEQAHVARTVRHTPRAGRGHSPVGGRLDGGWGWGDAANSCEGLRVCARAIDDESVDHCRAHVWG